MRSHGDVHADDLMSFDVRLKEQASIQVAHSENFKDQEIRDKTSKKHPNYLYKNHESAKIVPDSLF